jgi:ABC-2 type transport system permease protein
VAAFTGLGLLLAGTLRPMLTLAVTNALFVVLVLASGLLYPLDVLPAGAQRVLVLLPSTALGDALRAALPGFGPDPVAPLLVLALWALVLPALASWRFRWW